MTGRTYRCALCGLGNIAWRFGAGPGGTGSLSHAAAVAAHPGTELVAGCSPDDRDRHEFAAVHGVPVFPSLEEMLDAATPDLVSVCSPSELHAAHARLCLDRGAPLVWLEKPPAPSAAELEELEARRAGRAPRSTVLVNYQRRYTQSYRRLRQAFLDHRAGVCRLIEMQYSQGLENNGVHIVDLLFFLVGEGTPWRLLSVERAAGENPTFVMQIEGGPEVVVTGVDLPYHSIDVSLVCEAGRLSVLHGGMTPRVEERVEHELFPGFYRLRDLGESWLGSGGLDGSLDLALNDLVEAHEAGRRPMSDLCSAMAAQRLVEAVRGA